MAGHLRQYTKECMARSFVRWERGEAMTVLSEHLVRAAFAGIPGIAAAATFSWPVGLATWFLALLFILTPYWLWKEKVEKINQLEKKIEPKIRIIDTTFSTEPHESKAKSIRTYYITVRNDSAQELNNCLVKISNIVNEDGSTSAFPHVALRTRYKDPDKDVGPFHLRGGEPKFIAVATLDENDPGTEIRIHYADKHLPNKLNPDIARTVTLSAYAEKGINDERGYWMYLDRDGYFKFEEIPPATS